MPKSSKALPAAITTDPSPEDPRPTEHFSKSSEGQEQGEPPPEKGDRSIPASVPGQLPADSARG